MLVDNCNAADKLYREIREVKENRKDALNVKPYPAHLQTSIRRKPQKFSAPRKQLLLNTKTAANRPSV